MYGYIYKTTNLINGKIYIGQHKAEKFDTNYYGSGKIILYALNKYGKENFKCELIEWCDTQSTTNKRECYWIKFYNSRDKNIGYNVTRGGDGCRIDHHTQTTKDKISKSRTGIIPNREYIITDETKEKISDTLKEYYKTHDNPRKGVHLSESTKEKLRQANLGKIYSEEVRAKHRRPAWNKGIPMTKEAKKHLSEVNKGKPSKMSKEQREKARQRWQGKNNPNYGGLKAETKEKLRQAILGRIWITNGEINKQVTTDDFENIYKPQGFVKGRTSRKHKD